MYDNTFVIILYKNIKKLQELKKSSKCFTDKSFVQQNNPTHEKRYEHKRIFITKENWSFYGKFSLPFKESEDTNLQTLQYKNQPQNDLHKLISYEN